MRPVIRPHWLRLRTRTLVAGRRLRGFGQRHRLANRTRSLATKALEIGGLAALTHAAWLAAPAWGWAVGGAGLVYLSFALSMPRRRRP